MFDWKAHCQLWRTNLRITKRPMPFFCHKVAQGWSCGYAIRVWSTGPGVYNDKIEVRETCPSSRSRRAGMGCGTARGRRPSVIRTRPSARIRSSSCSRGSRDCCT